MQIPLAHQRTYALERYYYEFIERMGPAHLLLTVRSVCSDDGELWKTLFHCTHQL